MRRGFASAAPRRQWLTEGTSLLEPVLPLGLHAAQPALEVVVPAPRKVPRIVLNFPVPPVSVVTVV